MDPLSGEHSLPHLRAERSGRRSLHLREAAPDAAHSLPKAPPSRARQPDALKWMVASNSVHLPPKRTLYW